ncbi:MAG: ABC transporter ATP-binding protein [Nitrosopumilaceae archaeon]
MVFLRVEGLSADYITQKGILHAIDDVNFFLEKGESIGIAGESACGKSTLGLSMVRMLQGGKVVSGDVMFEDKSILKISEDEFSRKHRWKDIAMVFQGAMNSLDPVYSIEQQFIEVLRQHHFKDDFSKTISDAIESVGLNESVLGKYPHELSGGMKQRIVIAMALLLKPKFVIADEPTTALDVLVQAQIINLVKKLKKKGMSIMLITHDLAVLSEIADRIGVMYAGKMIEFGSAEEIYQNPKHPYTQALLESIPTLKSNKRPKYIKGNPPSLISPPSGCRFIDRCPEAMEKCKKVPPRFKTESGDVLCWLYE